MQRDLAVLRKNLGEFVTRTLVQPFLLVFVFLYVFPTIGQGVGSGGGRAGESAFATVLVPGVVGISIMFQGIQAVAMTLSQEFGLHPRDRGPGAGAVPGVARRGGQGGRRAPAQGVLAAAIVFPIAAVVHAKGVEAHLPSTG